MLIIRGTGKLRDRLTAPAPDAGDTSTTVLGDWFATALFWRPQVVLLVNARTLLPVFLQLAPARTLLERIPATIEAVLRRHGVAEEVIAVEREAMRDVRLAPTNDRSVVGCMTELALHGEIDRHMDRDVDLEDLSLRISEVLLGPLLTSSGSPDRQLAAVLGTAGRRAPRRQPATFPATSRPGSVYRLKITLLNTKPPIWRRVLVQGTATLGDLHEIIQAAFGWWDTHLHVFEVGPDMYGMPDPEWAMGPPTSDERGTRLDAIAEAGTSFRYTYDFGDDWEHRIMVEEVAPASPGIRVPSCIGGRRACPPEDCGGPWGYRRLLEVLDDPAHPERQELMEWIGGSLDPEIFDPGAFEENLRALRLARRVDGR